MIQELVGKENTKVGVYKFESNYKSCCFKKTILIKAQKW